MTTSQYSIILYVHPDEGPITPVEINLMQVEEAALNYPGDRDEIRFQEVVKCIKAQCPDVVPERHRQGIASILGRLRNVSQFNGIVLRLPGTIEDKPAAPSPTGDKLERLANEVVSLKAQFERERENYEASLRPLRQQIKELHSTNHQMHVQRDGLELELREAKDEMQRAQAQLNRIQGQLNRAQVEVERLSFENADLQTRLEQAERAGEIISQVAPAQAELSSLRQGLASAKQAEQQLRQALEQRESEIAKLREQIRRLSNDTPISVLDQHEDLFGDL
jgi:phage shock protein A